jgi:hypothetical protein
MVLSKAELMVETSDDMMELMTAGLKDVMMAVLMVNNWVDGKVV